MWQSCLFEYKSWRSFGLFCYIVIPNWLIRLPHVKGQLNGALPGLTIELLCNFKHVACVVEKPPIVKTAKLNFPSLSKNTQQWFNFLNIFEVIGYCARNDLYINPNVLYEVILLYGIPPLTNSVSLSIKRSNGVLHYSVLEKLPLQFWLAFALEIYVAIV